jgi:dTDP-4-amino-4,6-dideoxygalactose transaminase
VFDKKYLDVMKKTICFGYTETNKSVYNVNASNYKMSEINAIYTYEYLLNLNKIYEHHISIIIYFIDQLKIKNLNNKVKLFKNFSNYNESLLSTIPLVFNKPQSVDIFLRNNIEAKKYYYPLDTSNIHSMNIYEKIVCLPLNLDINYKIIDDYIDIIKNI